MMIILICEICWSFSLIFIFCEFGERASDGFDELDYVIGQLDWYTFPIEIQRKLPIVINIAQQPVVVRGFLNILCTREVFKKVSFQFTHLEY